VPIDKSTYLNLEDEIQTKYPKIYREYFDFTAKERDLKIFDENKQLRTQLEENNKTISVLLEKIRSLEQGQNTLSRMMNTVFDKLDIKKPKPEDEKVKLT
jgi:ATP phosphoribosyltransferase